MNNDWREYSYYDLDYLAHHGILGQKWGVRRFENANGHLTAAGLKRYEGGRKVTAKEKNAFSVKAAGHKAMAKVYGVNEKFYSKNNKMLANANKGAKNRELKKAEQAQKEANEKKAAKQNDPEAVRRKKMIIAGAAVVGTALATYGGYKYAQYVKNKAGNDIITKGFEQSKSLNDPKIIDSSFAKAKEVESSFKKSYEYLRDQKNNNLSGKAAVTKARQQTTNKLASEASALAKSVVAEGPKSFSKPAQNSAQKVSDMTAKKLASASSSYSSGKKTVSNITKISGQQKFNQAAKANDDYVSQMLKKNGSSLSNFSMSDLSKLDLY